MSRGNVPSLTRTQAAYVRSCVRMRRSMTNKAIAAKLGISAHTVTKYASGKRVGRE